MAWAHTVNQYVASLNNEIGRIFWDWWTLGIAQGILEIVGSGDGLVLFENEGQTAGPNYNVFTSAPGTAWNPALAGSYSNSKAWARVRMIGTTLEWIVQRDQSTSASDEDDFRIAISPNGFTGGGASAILAPTAADELYIVGTRTNGAQVFGSYATDQTYHIGFNLTAYNGFHSFYIAPVYTATKITVSGVWLFDACQEFVPGDVASWMFTRSTSVLDTTRIAGSITGYSVRDFGGGAELFSKQYSYAYMTNTSAGQTLWPNRVPAQIGDSKARSGPAFVFSYVLSEYKGLSSLLKWKGTSGRSYPDTVDLATADAHVYIDQVLLPWPTGITPL